MGKKISYGINIYIYMYIRIAFSIELRLRVSRSLRSLANKIYIYVAVRQPIRAFSVVRNVGRVKCGPLFKP